MQNGESERNDLEGYKTRDLSAMDCRSKEGRQVQGVKKSRANVAYEIHPNFIRRGKLISIQRRAGFVSLYYGRSLLAKPGGKLGDKSWRSGHCLMVDVVVD